MVVSWVLGDLVKIAYFVTAPTPQPTQFVIGGWCSVFFDFVVLWQMILTYPNETVLRARVFLGEKLGRNLGKGMFQTPHRRSKKTDEVLTVGRGGHNDDNIRGTKSLDIAKDLEIEGAEIDG